jgi:hypothetical protein
MSHLVTADPLARLLLAGLCGALVGLGAWIAVAAVRGQAVLPENLSTGRWRDTTSSWLDPDWNRRTRLMVAGGLLAAALIGLLTRIPVLGLLTAGVVWIAADATRGASVPELNRLGGAVASWCETVRQELDAGQPLRAAVLTSCDLPPRGLEAPLAQMAAGLESQPLPNALWGFAAEVRHPAVGQTVAALEVAYRLGAGDLPRLMASQVEATRHRVQVLRDVHAARAKHRRAMVMLLGLFVAVIGVLFAVWPAFLDAYRSLVGQAVLAGIGVTVLGAVRALVRLSQPAMPPDFFAGRTRGLPGARDVAEAAPLGAGEEGAR